MDKNTQLKSVQKSEELNKNQLTAVVVISAIYKVARETSVATSRGSKSEAVIHG